MTFGDQYKETMQSLGGRRQRGLMSYKHVYDKGFAGQYKETVDTLFGRGRRQRGFLSDVAKERIKSKAKRTGQEELQKLRQELESNTRVASNNMTRSILFTVETMTDKLHKKLARFISGRRSPEMLALMQKLSNDIAKAVEEFEKGYNEEIKKQSELLFDKYIDVIGAEIVYGADVIGDLDETKQEAIVKEVLRMVYEGRLTNETQVRRTVLLKYETAVNAGIKREKE